MKDAVKDAPVIIAPTVGRPVWYFPFTSEFMEQGPRAALIAKVISDRLVNLAVFDQNGIAQARPNVTLVQEGDKIPTTAYCRFEVVK